ncbi:MAG: hypothetical protein ACKOWF_17565 [Chloroflexota bacterium]
MAAPILEDEVWPAPGAISGVSARLGLSGRAGANARQTAATVNRADVPIFGQITDGTPYSAPERRR